MNANFISQIRVVGLFGDRTLEVQFDSDEPITALYGPNGSGKSTLLKILDAMFSEKAFDQLFQIQFELIEVALENGNSIIAKKEFRAEGSSGTRTFLESLGLTDEDPFEVKEVGREVIKVEVHEGSSLMYSREFWRKRDWTQWFGDDRLNQRQVRKNFLDKLIVKEGINNFDAIRSEITPLFIQTDRLTEVAKGASQSVSRDTVEVASEDLAKHIQRSMADQGKHSNSNQFDLLESIRGTYSAEAPDSILDWEAPRREIHDMEKRLAALDLVGHPGEFKEIEVPSLHFTHQKILTDFYKSQKAKLAFFEEDAAKIEACIQILNRKFGSFELPKSHQKFIKPDRIDGYQVFRNSENGELASKLQLSELSSGEKHILVLIHKLIFSEQGKVRPNLFLIDEPELSLHVEWARQLKSDFEQIQSQFGGQFIYATHSPILCAGNAAPVIISEFAIKNK